MKLTKVISTLLTGLALALPMATSAATYNGTTVAPAADGKTYTVNANAGDTVTLSSVGQDAGQLAITFAASASGTVVINQSSTVPASATAAAPGQVATYYDVTLNGFTNSAVSNATWQFSTANSVLSTLGLAAANVRLYHFTGSTWVAQPTQVLSATSTATNFSATTSSFSPFAVAGSTGLATTGSSLALGVFVAVALLIAVGFAVKQARKRA